MGSPSEKGLARKDGISKVKIIRSSTLNYEGRVEFKNQILGNNTK